jgi:pyruvate dehydrogenase E1 component
MAATNTGVITYDPAYGYEIGHIIRSGLERMYGGNHPDPNVVYYLTVYNEPIVQPAEPENVDIDGIIRGIHRVSKGAELAKKAQILASGVALPWAFEAQRLLLDDWGVSADIWSVTSWTELRRDALAKDEQRFLNPGQSVSLPYITNKLVGSPGPFLGVSDYMHQVPDQIRKWIPGEYATLGADGFGFSDTRAAARRHFKIDGPSIATRVLQQLASRGEVPEDAPLKAIEKYRLLDVSAGTSGATGGDA